MLWRCSREPEFGAGKIFRPHRDVRFSNDKSPYKTHCSAVINVPGGAFYTQVGADGLRRVLAAVSTSRTALQRGGEMLRSRPRGGSADHPRMDLLRHRSLYLWRSWPPEEVLDERACLDRIQEAWRTTRPLVEWLARHVGVAVI
jgi:uncharacterized protein (DUF2461 family)